VDTFDLHAGGSVTVTEPSLSCRRPSISQERGAVPAFAGVEALAADGQGFVYALDTAGMLVCRPWSHRVDEHQPVLPSSQ
jgi:hypothetical protein